MGNVMNQKKVKGELLIAFQMAEESNEINFSHAELRSLNKTFRRYEMANEKSHNFKRSSLHAYS